MLPKDPKEAEEYKKNLSKSLTGRKLSEEHKQRCREAKLKNPVKYWLGKKREASPQKIWRENHPEKYKQITDNYNKKWVGLNREKKSEYSRKYYLEHKEITGDWRRENQTLKKEELAGRPKPDICEICQEHGRMNFDHDHKTGKFRGWICFRCNVTLGRVDENINLLKALIIYLKKNKSNS